jgi:GxxExxY protein
MDKLIHQNETYQIIGISMEVHRHLGFGFAEIVYTDTLQIEVELARLRMEREKEYEIIYKGRKLCHKYFADFVMFDNIIVEIKASCDGISDEHICKR